MSKYRLRFRAASGGWKCVKCPQCNGVWPFASISKAIGHAKENGVQRYIAEEVKITVEPVFKKNPSKASEDTVSPLIPCQGTIIDRATFNKLGRIYGFNVHQIRSFNEYQIKLMLKVAGNDSESTGR